MVHKVRGGGFRIAGLVLGIIATILGIQSIVFSSIGLIKAKEVEKKYTYKFENKE